MSFFIRRYLCGVSRRKGWLLLSLAPLMVYVLYSAVTPDRYLVRQKIPVTPDMPVAVPSSLAAFMTVGDLIARPAELFEDSYALMEISKKLDIEGRGEDAGRSSRILRMVLDKEVTIRDDSGGVVIEYLGSGEKLGEKIVVFYSQRLLERMDQGVARSRRVSEGQAAGSSGVLRGPDSSQRIGIGEELKPLSGMIRISPAVVEQTAIWRPERKYPAAVIWGVSLALLLTLLGVLEWSDPSFKSERQVARYLGMRIAGSIPDLNKLGRAVGKMGNRD